MLHILNDMLRGLPDGGLLILGFAGLLGLLLWISGARVARPMLTVVGAVIGAAGGLVLSEWLRLPLPVWVGPAIGAVILAIVGNLAYRPIIAIACGVILALLGPVIVWTWITSQDLLDPAPDSTINQQNVATDEPSTPEDPREEETVREAIDRQLADMAEREGRRWLESQYRIWRERLGFGSDSAEPGGEHDDQPGADEGIEPLPTTTPGWVVRLDEQLSVDFDGLQGQWERMNARLRLAVLLSAIVMGLMGLLIGFSRPNFAAAAVTSLLGGSFLLGTGLLLSERWLDSPTWGWLPTNPVGWLIWWFALTAIGIVIQAKTRHESSDST